MIYETKEITISKVKSNAIDSETFDPDVLMSIAPGIKLPTDTVASTSRKGIVGGKCVRLKPGVEKSYIEAGGAIS